MSNINYAVSGTIELSDIDKTLLTVSGNMVIDDTLREWNNDPSTPGATATSPLEYLKYSYFISDYSFAIYPFSVVKSSPPNTVYHFSGNAGSFYMERPEGGVMGDLMWFLENGSGNWTQWTGENFFCYNELPPPYNLYNDMFGLAPIIKLTDLNCPISDTILTSQMTTNILLIKLLPATSEAPLSKA